jgi:hypothetical protein
LLSRDRLGEGQEHQIDVRAQRAIFAGGDFMFCLLRNAQMTLHGMVKQDAPRIDFVFPAQAIWAADIWGPDDKRPYPAPMVLLTALFGRRANDTEAWALVFRGARCVGAPCVSLTSRDGVSTMHVRSGTPAGPREGLSPPLQFNLVTARPFPCWPACGPLASAWRLHDGPAVTRTPQP